MNLYSKAIFHKDRSFTIAVFLIIALSIFFRTYNYADRVFIQADNSRDVQVARYAADNFKLPQIGQFSSAGPFFYGPLWYWILEIVSFLPFGFLTHWYFVTFLYFVFILLIYWLGKETGGNWLGILAALFAGISPTQINYSFSSWNPSVVPLLALISLVFLVRFFKYKRKLDIFFLGLTTGAAITIHFQNFLILPTIVTALFSFRTSLRNYLKFILSWTLGFLIPLLPLVYFDLRFHWHNFISIFVYLTVDQYSIWVPNRWLTYAGVYWQGAWAEIIGGSRLIAVAIISLLSVFFILRLRQFLPTFSSLNKHNLKNDKVFYLIAVTFVIEFVLYRYYRGERYQYYILFAHPWVILLTAWTVFQVFRFNRLLGLTLTVLVCIFTIKQSLKDLAPRGITLAEVNSLKNQIYSNYPSGSFDIYGCEVNSDSISHPLALAMYHDGRNKTDGIKIGVCEGKDLLEWSVLSKKDVTTKKVFWVNKSTETVYKSTVEWWKVNPPERGGSFREFIKTKFSPRCYPHC